MNSENSLLDTEDDSPNPPHREWPLVSVIVATYQRPTLLRRALDSVLAQTLTDIEVWCIHDGPLDDGTVQVYEDYVPKFEAAGIDFYPTGIEEHTGYYTTPRNVATENCRGVYVANLDDDNEWVPTALADLLAAMEEGETWPDLVYGRRHYILDPGAPTKHNDIDLVALQGDSMFTPWDDLAMLRVAGNQPMFNFIDSGDFMVTKGALYRLGLKAGHIWDDSKRRFGDFYLVSDGLHIGEWRFKALDKVVQIYHITGSNLQLTRPIHEVPHEVRV